MTGCGPVTREAHLQVQERPQAPRHYGEHVLPDRHLMFPLAAPRRVELLEEGCSYPFDRLHLLGGEILSPPPRLGLPIELALTLLLLGDVLPGVLLHSPGELLLVHLDPQGGVNAAHRAQCIRPQVFVSDQDLRTLMDVVGPFAVAYVPQILIGTPPHKRVRLLVRQRFLQVPALVVPASLSVSIHARGNYIPGIPDQQDHTALRKGLHEQRSAYRAVGLLDDQILVFLEVRESRPRLLQYEAPHGLEPALPVASQDEVFCFVTLLVGPEVVEVAEEQPHHRLPPEGLSL